jgi:plasmid maintenance system antidote protein VapI
MVAMRPNKRTAQKEIARLAKIGPDFLSHIIHGRRPCPPSVAVRLEEVTGIRRVTWV